MDLGCLDLGCISVLDKLSNETVADSSSNKESEKGDPVSANSKLGKSKSPKGNNQTSWNALNKCTSQIKKPPHRKNSPLSWFPRRKVDSYLKRKIKLLQEVDGMNLTLDETLGDTNPHYSRVLREKIAAREAAHKAMEARKAALVEASWCRILKGARIQSKEAEDLLLKSEKAAVEAFEVAAAMGVIMYDKPSCPQVHYQIETSLANGEGSTTHTVTASFETAFEVDKEVASAVKTAFVRLANYPPFSKDEFKDLLHKINENPETGDGNHEVPEFSSGCESKSESELEIVSENNGFGSQDVDSKMPVLGMKQSKSKRRQSSENLNRASLVEVMFERLKCLQEDELSSLATIVATCGLNAALAEVEYNKMHYPISETDFPHASVPNNRRISSLGAGTTRSANFEYFMNGAVRGKQQNELELPSLDKFLVKHMSKLQREVQEAKNSKMNESMETIGENTCKTEDGKLEVDNGPGHSETASDLGSVHLKHSPKFAKEIDEAKNCGDNSEMVFKNSEAKRVPNEVPCTKKDVLEIPSLDKFLVKHVSRLEKEVQEAKNRRNNDPIEEAKDSGNYVEMVRKNPEVTMVQNGVASHRKEDVPEVPSLDKFLLKRVSSLEKDVQEAKNRRNNDPIEEEKDSGNNFEMVSNNPKVTVVQNEVASHRKEDVPEVPSLDKFLVKCVSRLEKEVQEANNRRNNDPIEEEKDSGNNVEMVSNNPEVKVMRNEFSSLRKVDVPEVPSLDKFLVKHVSRLEKEVQEAKSRRINGPVEVSRAIDLKKKINGAVSGKENVDLNKEDYRFSEQKDMKAKTIDSLDKILVKPVHRLEREKMQALSEGNNYWNEGPTQKQGRNNSTDCEGLDKVLVKHVSRLEREKMQALSEGNNYWNEGPTQKQGRNNSTDCEGLDKVLVKHVSRLEKEKMKFNASEIVKMKRSGVSMHLQSQMKEEESSLDQVLVKHKSRLERAKIDAAVQKPEEQVHIRPFVSRREARERELQEAWGGLSLGNSIRPHFSKLERDKAAWIKAEEEERMQATRDVV